MGGNFDGLRTLDMHARTSERRPSPRGAAIQGGAATKSRRAERDGRILRGGAEAPRPDTGVEAKSARTRGAREGTVRLGRMPSCGLSRCTRKSAPGVDCQLCDLMRRLRPLGRHRVFSKRSHHHDFDGSALWRSAPISLQAAIHLSRGRRHSLVKTNRLVMAAVLAVAIEAPIAGFVGDISMAQPTAPSDERSAFFHGPAGGPVASQSGLAALDRADAWINSPPLTAA